jgi:DNA-binding MarR family transcriptional regulator
MSELPRSQAAKSGMVILIPKQLRMDWIDVMALDQSLSHVTVRVAMVIAFHLNKYSGKAFLTQELIAEILGISERTVFSAIKELEERRYVIVRRREFGTIVRKTPTGREILVRVAGGKGVANTYTPTVDGSQVSATNRGLMLAKRCELIVEQRSQKSVPKVAASCEPTLSPPTEENPSPHCQPNDGGTLGSIGAVIRISMKEEGGEWLVPA